MKTVTDSTSSGERAACPVCGHPMSEHTLDHSTPNTILNCPVPHPGGWDRDAYEKVNELGMVIHRGGERR